MGNETWGATSPEELNAKWEVRAALTSRALAGSTLNTLFARVQENFPLLEPRVAALEEAKAREENAAALRTEFDEVAKAMDAFTDGQSAAMNADASGEVRLHTAHRRVVRCAERLCVYVSRVRAACRAAGCHEGDPRALQRGRPRADDQVRGGMRSAAGSGQPLF